MQATITAKDQVNTETLNFGSYNLANLSKINIILGKNGCGKSTLLRECLNQLQNGQNQNIGLIKYISPERGGNLNYDAGIDQGISSNPQFLYNRRKKNQADQFKQESAAQFRTLKILVLEEIEKNTELRNDLSYTFDSYIEKINSLLDQIYIKRSQSTFTIHNKGSNDNRDPITISSGENELISLGIESLCFSKEAEKHTNSILLLDEPDVHLHPDLQVRLMHFLKDLVKNQSMQIMIATHSTAILGALESFEHTRVAFIRSGDRKIEFNSVTDELSRILPVFGAHPLSNLFNQAPILLVEGEDDERIWQQVVRSSRGRIKIYPCVTGSITELDTYEEKVRQIISSVYENAKAFSLRDRDDVDESTELDDHNPIIRCRLKCRNAENLLLSDEVLKSLGITWEQVKENIENWLSKNSDHQYWNIMNQFKQSNFDRKNFNLKFIRNLLIGQIIAKDKPWEVAIGQVIANLGSVNDGDFNREGSIANYLGRKIVSNLIT